MHDATKPDPVKSMGDTVSPADTTPPAGKAEIGTLSVSVISTSGQPVPNAELTFSMSKKTH